MMTMLRRLRPVMPGRPRRSGEDGYAMILVTIFIAVGMIMMVTAYDATNAMTNRTRRGTDWTAAIAAADAGIDDYLTRLTVDDNYWKYSKTNPPPGGNPALTDWASVPHDDTGAIFQYAPDTTNIGKDGTFSIMATGRVRGVERKVKATIRRASPLDYLYFTDKETKDPSVYNSNDYFTAANAAIYCSMRYWEGRNSNCTDIYFASMDTLNGPIHSNDAFLLSGTPKFNGKVTTGWQNAPAPRYRGTATPSFNSAGDPTIVLPMALPKSSSWLKAKTNSTYGGCLYTGPTRIVFNSNGTMDVTSPYTKSSNCNRGSGVAIPANGVIYVQSVPASSSDPNYTAGCPYSSGHPLRGTSASSATTGQNFLLTSDITSYDCRAGDAFVQGVVNGGVTVGTENKVIITDDLTYANGTTVGSSNDVLGLVANTNVEIYHPVNSSGTNLALPTNGNAALTNLTLYCAMLAVNDTVRVQNYEYGSPLGTLTINGAFAQNYRGTVGTFSGSTLQTGYAKNYSYDTRLAYLTPPSAMDPYTTSWKVTNWQERTGQSS